MGKQFLRGKIAAILDDQRLIIGLGMEDGVCLGDQFVIYENGADIHHPDTHEILGKLELVKAKVEAVHVQERISLVMPVQKESTTQSTVLSATLAQTSSGSATDIYRDHLYVKKDQIIGVPQINASIQVGNLIRSIKAVEK